MSLTKYSTIVVTAVAAPLAVLWLVLGARQDGTFAGVALGAVLAALNTLAAYALVDWSDARSNAAFFRAVVGGTLGRMVILLAAVAGAVLGLGLPRMPLVIALLTYYAAFLVLELAVVHRRLGSRREAVS